MEGRRLVVDIPPIPLTEALLVAVAVLLYCCLRTLREGLGVLKELQKGAATGQEQQQHALGRSATPSRNGSMVLARPSAQMATPPSPVPMVDRPVERFLQLSAQRFAECLLDQEDVDTREFIRACRHFATVLEKAGPFTMLSIRETHSNIAKIEQTYLLNSEKFRSMFAMLEEECSTGMHAPGGILADPSAAIGLLWARRGLQFWVSIVKPHVNKYLRQKQREEDAHADADGGVDAVNGGMLGSGPGTPTRARAHTWSAGLGAPSPSAGSEGDSDAQTRLSDVFTDVAASANEFVSKAAEATGGFKDKLLSGVISAKGYEEALRAYSESIEPFNGWIARNTFTLTARATPDWESFGCKLAPDKETLDEDTHLWSTAVSAVLKRMEDMHQKLDLEDLRKTI